MGVIEDEPDVMPCHRNLHQDDNFCSDNTIVHAVLDLEKYVSRQ